MTTATWFYRIAAHAVAPVLRSPCVRSVYIRRSVATGEADFPWSDLDLGLVAEGLRGADVLALYRRFLVARTMFPRLGECQIVSAAELCEIAEADPYRASLDRRFAVTVAGPPPHIPRVPVSLRAAARRLIFWFERYLPRAVRSDNIRNQRKYVAEMLNALGVIEGRWPEPLKTRAAVAAAGGLPPETDSGFATCCHIAARAWSVLAPADPPPPVRQTVVLPGLTVLPVETAPWPAGTGPVVTPVVVRLLLETHNPFLWLSHGSALRALGFPPPSGRAWVEAALRLTGGEHLRRPGFIERGVGRHADILGQVDQVLGILEGGGLPDAGSDLPITAVSGSVSGYYRDDYDALSAIAARLRRRAVACARQVGLEQAVGTQPAAPHG
ncbi:MAG: hypothetical protein ACKOCW_11150 [Planctomycetaceae bacterium]